MFGDLSWATEPPGGDGTRIRWVVYCDIELKIIKSKIGTVSKWKRRN